MIQGSDELARGAMKQGVCVAKHIVAASRVDGSIVNIVSNADNSGTTTVYRRIKQERVPCDAPTCVREYNSAMQGVDRHNQLRGRLALADGHSFKIWHKKMALAFIDIARCNAYICHQLASIPELNGEEDLLGGDEEGSARSGRGKHRSFVASLVREMFDGSWSESLDNDDCMLYTGSCTSSGIAPSSAEGETETKATDQIVPNCVVRESWLELKGRSRAMRECVVCRFEGRRPTQKTDYCR
ncbi:unnamed protein product [Phytophthora fragariaefolia]|uniref:Unnamed protein product n=1 Tax=Phytophthora fragariaefolia TaxID=1490495 RepID=A0A9W6Y521_9STRA|nr:unnamed protein product [Phytophthora fragariaefolia]